MILNSVVPELILLASLVLQIACLGAKDSGLVGRLFYVLISGTFLLALIASVCVFAYPEEVFFHAMLKSTMLFRSVRISLLVSGIFLSRFVYCSKAIPVLRKREAIFLLSAVTWLASILLLSENLMISFLCLFGMASAAIFWTGLPFKDRKEGEAVLKFWAQFTLMVILGIAGLALLAFQAGDLSYSTLRNFYTGLSGEVLYFFWVLLAIGPMMLMAGVFPFHFLIIDRDHGAVWPLQAASTILISGASVVALLKASIQFFFSSGAGASVLFLLMVLSFLGMTWGLLGALTQKSTKRYMAFFSVAQWALCFLTIAKPSELSLSSAIFYYLHASVAMGLLFWGLATLHEESKSDEDWDSIIGFGRRFITPSRMILLGLMSLMFLPPSAGFVALLNLLGSMFEQKSIVLVLFTCIGLLLTLLATLRLLADVFFREGTRSSSTISVETSAAIDRFIFMICLIVIVSHGLYGDLLMRTLMQSAKTFIIF